MYVAEMWSLTKVIGTSKGREDGFLKTSDENSRLKKKTCVFTMSLLDFIKILIYIGRVITRCTKFSESICPTPIN